ncbi:MAG: ABC transporter ATP-binding protein [Planctomycetota bacterium]|jgi:ABC-type lipoprotein export system ATPase subunit
MNKEDNNSPILQTHAVEKTYRMGRETLHVLRGVDLEVRPARWLGIFGASGSGKSTLLHLMGGLDTPDKGSVSFKNQNIFELSTARRDRFRNRHVGFVFQSYHLLPELNVLENTVITAMVGHSVLQWPGHKARAHKRAADLLDRLGLGDRLRHRPNELSGGERQRVAIARALINEPDVLLADEPTGNLDAKTGAKILDLLASLRDQGQTIVMVTHDHTVAHHTDQTLALEQGKLTPPRA